VGGGPWCHTSAGGTCHGGNGGSAKAAARADGEVQGAGVELVVALVTRTGNRRGLAPVGRPRQLGADGAGSPWRSGTALA
jgi:hypothetical protein